MTLGDYTNLLRTMVDRQATELFWRKGQTLFNVLYEMYPDLANEIRGTPLDPFYEDRKIKDFMNFIASKIDSNSPTNQPTNSDPPTPCQGI